MRGVTLHGVLVAVALGAPAPAAALQQGADGGRRTADEAGRDTAETETSGEVADGEGSAAGEAMAEARSLFERGTLLMRNENWAVARVELARSFEVYPTRSALFNLAMCDKALHAYVASLRHFERWQERFAVAASEDERRAVAAAMDELRQFLGTLGIATVPSGATIRIDGEEVGTTPLATPLVVTAGTHTVEASLEGYVTARAELLVAPLEAAQVPLRLEPAAGAGPAAVPGAGGGAEPAGDGLHAGWFWGVAGTAAAMGMGGAVAGGITLDKEGDLDALGSRCRTGERAACDEGQAMLGEHDDAQLAANVLLFGAAAFAVTAVVLAFFTDFGFGDEAPPVQVTVTPAADDTGTPAGATLGVVVAF